MGLDVGVVTGKIEYLDRALFADLDDFLSELWVSADGNSQSFEFISRDSWDDAVAAEVDGMTDTEERQFRKKAEAFFVAAAALSPDGESQVLLHANW